MRRNLLVHGLSDPLDYFRIARQYSLKGLEDRIQCPTFVCSAEGDDLSIDGEKFYDALGCPKRTGRHRQLAFSSATRPDRGAVDGPRGRLLAER